MPRETFVELSVKLSSGAFNCSLCVPVDATKDLRDEAVKAWLAAMKVAVSIGNAEPTTEIKPQ